MVNFLSFVFLDCSQQWIQGIFGMLWNTYLLHMGLENVFLPCLDVDGGSYELYIVLKYNVGRSDAIQYVKRGIGVSTFFVVHNRFTVLVKES